ncbi:HET-domain-containing protein, partial [Aulographum hederae CBS 113979]
MEDLIRQLARAAGLDGIADSEHSFKPEPIDTGLDDYVYEYVTPGEKCIRILKLLPSPPSNPNIDCELIETKVDEDNHQRFEALSWCWGTTGETSQIRIKQGSSDLISKKTAKPDLVKALHVLRNRNRPRYLWIDAVCINQANMDEKNHQVEMMAYIYGKATRVCIWLGERDASSQLALNFIRDEVLRLQNFDDLCENTANARKWAALLDLMQRPWFRRRWVVQEIALARRALIYCGPDRISWKKFSIAVELFVEVETATHRLSEVMKLDSTFHHMPGWFDYVSQLGASLLVNATGKLFRDHKELKSGSMPTNDSVTHPAKKEVDANDHTPRRQPLLSLEFLVSSLAIFDVTKTHDTIYALLAISKDTMPKAPFPGSIDLERQTKANLEMFTERKQYEVDYKKPYVDVCQYFIKFCVDRCLQHDPSRALDIILRPWAVEERIVSESYQEEGGKEKKETAQSATVPNAQSLQERKVQPYTALPSWVPQLSRSPFAMQRIAGRNGEKVTRAHADPLVGLPSHSQRNYNAAETKKMDMRTFRFRKRVSMDGSNKLNFFSMYVRGFVLDEISEVKDVSQSGNIPSDWADFARWPGAKGDPPDAFWRTLVADRGPDGKNPPVYYSRACKESFEKGGFLSGSIQTSDLIRNQRVSVIAQFCWRVQAVIWKRALARTKENRLALVNPGVKKGDQVCILYGCSVPVILRKHEKHPEAVELEA